MENNMMSSSYTALTPDHMVAPDAAINIVLGVIEQIKMNGDNLFTVGDYGTADGGTSMNLMCKIIGKVKELHGEDFPVQIVYEDQPDNDYNTLFKRICGRNCNPTYMYRFKNIYPMATSTSFYQQCVPTESMDLIVSFNAMHRLSESPCNIPDSVAIFRSNNEHVKQVWSSQADEDWETVLLMREKELKPGGFFLCGIKAIREHGDDIYRIMSDVWRQFVSGHIISQQEFYNTNVNTFVKSIDDIGKPLEDPNSKVCDLKLVGIYPHTLKTPSYEEFKKTGKTPESYTKTVVDYMMSWALPTFREGLSKSRSADEKEDIIDKFVKRVAQTIANDPSKVRCCLEMNFVLIQKQI